MSKWIFECILNIMKIVRYIHLSFQQPFQLLKLLMTSRKMATEMLSSILELILPIHRYLMVYFDNIYSPDIKISTEKNNHMGKYQGEYGGDWKFRPYRLSKRNPTTLWWKCSSIISWISLKRLHIAWTMYHIFRPVNKGTRCSWSIE